VAERTKAHFQKILDMDDHLMLMKKHWVLTVEGSEP
jgi:hypothetical protein